VLKFALAFSTVALTFLGLFLSQAYEYLLFHNLAELFSVVIGCVIFLIAWNARRFLQNQYLMLLGVAFLFVSMLDLAHMLSYRGMPIFHGYDTDLPTQLWIAARGLESLSLLAAPFMLKRPIRAEILLLVYALVTVLLLLLIFVWRLFPVCYVEGVGLTPFKRISEYVICLILVAAIILLLRKRDAFDPQVLRWLVWSLVLTILSELAFTSYVSVSDTANLLGHFLKIISFYLIYKAIIETGLAKPFALLLREEKLAEENLERIVRERTATLQATTDQLNSFVYSIAHDLRAPLRAQHGYASILLEEHGQALGSGRKWVDRITAAAKRMDALVADLLSYATISSETPPLSKLDLPPLIERALRSLKPAPPAAAVIDTAAVNGAVLAHADSLELAVRHLLSNALKFVPEDRAPRVRLWTEVRGEWVRLWVEDNGIGIAPQYHDKVFGLFQRLHPGSEDSGTGIGLALVKQTIQRLGGRVGLESEPGKGSRFWLELKDADHRR